MCSGEGPPKADLMAFSPSLPPCRQPEVEEEEQSIEGDHSIKVGYYFFIFMLCCVNILFYPVFLPQIYFLEYLYLLSKEHTFL